MRTSLIIIAVCAALTAAACSAPPAAPKPTVPTATTAHFDGWTITVTQVTVLDPVWSATSTSPGPQRIDVDVTAVNVSNVNGRLETPKIRDSSGGAHSAEPSSAAGRGPIGATVKLTYHFGVAKHVAATHLAYQRNHLGGTTLIALR